MKRIIIFSVFASWILTSCSPVLYAPTTQVTPLHEKKGAADIGGSAGMSGYEAHINYAISNHIAAGVQGRIAGFPGKSNDEMTGTPDVNNTFGANVTWFNTVPSNPALRYGITGGINAGHAADKYNQYAESHNSTADHRQFYIQPAYGYFSKNFEAIASCNLSSVTLTNVQSDWADLSNQSSLSFLHATPAITLKGGSKTIKAFVQSGYTFTNNAKAYSDVTSFWGGNVNLSAGVQLQLGRQ